MMRTSIKLLALLFALTPGLAGAAGPVRDGGPFGLGLEFGDPGTWGVSGKFWIDRENALQPAVKFGGGAATLQFDYLWHTYDLIIPREGFLPFYFGAGGDLIVADLAAFGARGVVGISYIFDKANVPVDIYVQVAPTLWFFDAGTAFRVYGQAGGRYYF
jgi:hypothetical protein